jgi:hypothetical protein
MTLVKALNALRSRHSSNSEEIKREDLEAIFGKLNSPESYIAALTQIVEQRAYTDATDPVLARLDGIYEKLQDRAISRGTYESPSWQRIEQQRGALLDQLDRGFDSRPKTSMHSELPFDYNADDDEEIEPTDEELRGLQTD